MSTTPTSVLVRVNVRPQNRVHAREMALALSLEPLEHVAVNTQMHGGLASRPNHPCTFPEIFADGRSLRRIGVCLTRAGGGFSLDRAKRISHTSTPGRPMADSHIGSIEPLKTPITTESR